ncbi:MAG TPA: DUF1127 domain-containing protein [Geminicoccaceae bacterium]|nr:DUF1127 domain-containing protein [Geminicoccaceae bacterium]
MPDISTIRSPRGPYGLGAPIRDARRGVPLAGAFSRLAAAIVRELRIRRAERELMTMDEYMLRDIGVARDEIGHAVRFGRYR